MTGPVPLDAAARRTVARDLPGRTPSEDFRHLRRTFRLADLDAGVLFVSGVAARARARDHHPDTAFGRGDVTLRLTIRSAGGVARHGVALARDIAAVAPR